jgi:hypothetical protein
MKKILGILFAVVLVASLGLVMTVGVVTAATAVPSPTAWYVAEGGAGVQDGSNWNNAFPTIQQAIYAAGPGDTITVAAGTYAAFHVIDRNNIHIIGAEGATVATTNLYAALPVVGNAWVLAVVYNSTNINIEGINFDGAGVSGKTVVVGIAYVDSTGMISRLTVENVMATAQGVGVAIIGYAGTSTVDLTAATVKNSMIGIFVVHPNAILEAHFNSIVGNTLCGACSFEGGILDATRNWWGDVSGPHHSTANPDGSGNTVSDNVDFKPWLGAPDIVIQTVTDRTVDARTQAQTEVLVDGTATVIIAKYASNPHPSSGIYGAPASLDLVALLDEFEELNIFRDVYVTNTTQGTEIEMRLYYTDTQAENFTEDTLRPFWWNGTAWVQCSDSDVNTASVTVNATSYSGYMWAKITATTTPKLADLQGTEWGGYGHPTVIQPPCFCMATAAAASGTNTASKLGSLRQFRDTVLLPNSLGARLVSFYYEISPPIAGFISQHEVLRTVVRAGLVDPIVAILNSSHDLWSARRL